MESITLITDLFKYNTGYLIKHLTSMERKKLAFQPDKRSNPIYWIFGHIIVSRANLVELLGGEACYREYSHMFASGTRPQTDASAYPKVEKMLAAWSQLGLRMNKLLTEGGETLLNRQVWGNYDTLGKHVVSSYIHESYHVGQINYLLSMIKRNSSPISAKLGVRKNSTGKILLDNLKSVLTVK